MTLSRRQRKRRRRGGHKLLDSIRRHGPRKRMAAEAARPGDLEAEREGAAMNEDHKDRWARLFDQAQDELGDDASFDVVAKRADELLADDEGARADAATFLASYPI